MNITNHHREFVPAAGRDFFLPLYDPIVGLLGGDRARQELVEQAKLEAHHQILDLGCGTGTLVVMLKRRYPPARVVGIDPDRKALRRAENKARRASVSVQLDHGFADELPYERASFERVLSSFMFHHLQEHEREQTLKEVLRVLKPGGSFHLLDFTAHEHGSQGRWDRLVESHAQLKQNSDDRILQLMTQAGFETAEKVKDDRMLLGLLRTAYYRAV